MSNKKTRTKRTEIIEQEELQENPLSKQIKKFFDTGEYNPELEENQIEIRVQRWSDKHGKYVTLVGTKYTNLEGLIEAVGRKFGSGKYKFYCKVKDAEGKQVAGAVIEDYDFIWDSEEEPEGNPEVEQEEVVQYEQPNMMLELMKQQLENQNQLLLAILSQKGGPTGGMKSSEMLEAIHTGMELAGMRVNDEGKPEENFDIMKLLNGPIGQALMKKLLETQTETPPQVPT